MTGVQTCALPILEIIENGTADEADKALAALGDTDENLKKLLEEFKNEGK